jgi:hypothetical protein
VQKNIKEAKRLIKEWQKNQPKNDQLLEKLRSRLIHENQKPDWIDEI